MNFHGKVIRVHDPIKVKNWIKQDVTIVMQLDHSKLLLGRRVSEQFKKDCHTGSETLP